MKSICYTLSSWFHGYQKYIFYFKIHPHFFYLFGKVYWCRFEIFCLVTTGKIISFKWQTMNKENCFSYWMDSDVAREKGCSSMGILKFSKDIFGFFLRTTRILKTIFLLLLNSHSCFSTFHNTHVTETPWLCHPWILPRYICII